VDREIQYQEFVALCESKGLPIPTMKEWGDFIQARDRMKPHDEYVVRMVNFAKNLAEDFRVPLKMTIFAPPARAGLGLLRIGLGNKKSEVSVSELSILSPESNEILFRNKEKFLTSPIPVIFQDEGNNYFAGSERDWVRANITRLSATLARNFIQEMGMEQGR